MDVTDVNNFEMKCYRYCLSALFAIVATSVASQNIISGKILNNDTQQGISYVSIGIANKNSGTVSDSSGYFSLQIGTKVSLADSVTFYHSSYVPMNVCYNDLLNTGNRIYLIAKQPTQSSINSYRHINPAILGHDRTGAKMLLANFFNTSEIESSKRVSREMGMIFRLNKSYLLKTANIYIGKNDYKNIKFRLSFYSVENNFPKDLIVDHDIICSIKDEYEGWVSIDLNPYNIYIINRKAIAVTLTIIESERSSNRNQLSILGSIKSNTLVIRDRTLDIWKSISGQTLAIYFECDELAK